MAKAIDPVRVRYLQCVVGDYFVREVGHECEVDGEEARRLIEAGIAEKANDGRVRRGSRE